MPSETSIFLIAMSVVAAILMAIGMGA